MSSRGNITQSELLQWSVINTATASEDAPASTEPPVQHQPIESKWIDLILGKGDSVRMRECVEAALDESRSVETRELACDELEMLVESLDNANGITAIANYLTPLKLWAPIISLLSSNEVKMRMYGAWVLGTAVQNNPVSQKGFMEAGGIESILRVLEHDEDDTVRTKAFYCISGAIRNNKQVFQAFYNLNGFRVIVSALKNADSSLLRRAVFFWRTLLLDSGGDDTHKDTTVSDLTAAALSEYGVARMVMQLIDDADLDTVEKCLDLLCTVLAHYPSSLDVDTLEDISGPFASRAEGRFKCLQELGDDVSEARSQLQILVDSALSAASLEPNQ
ncbi:hypothetical protein BSLG_008144 [Batrachochytrium salamandrivorans]|nr:hypothetical protein BSLG_008144 [Batrachochytrium salamandrivorans]